MGIQKNFVVRNGIEVNNNLIFADSDSGKVGIATTNVQYTLHVNGGIGATSINVTNAIVTGVTTAKDLIINGRVTAGSSLGIAGQYLISTGTGVTWAALPSVRTVDTQTASASQTVFTTQYLVGLLDVYVNGVRLSSDEYTANNSINVVLDSPCFGGETVEFVSYSSVAPGAGFTGIQGLTILEEGVQVGSPLQVTSINFVGSDVTATGSGIAVTVYSQSSQWETVASGIATSSNVGIGTTDPQYKLHVVGAGSTALYVDGDARIVGILTVGSASITLDGTANIINVGSGVTLDGSTGTINASSLILNGTSVTGTALSVSVRGGISGEDTSEVTDVKAIRFNSPTFSVTDLGNGEVFVNSESTFKTWYVDGEPTLVASGDDYVEFIAGPGIAITTRNTASGVGTGEVKSVTITSTGGGGGESYWSSNVSGIHTSSNVGIGTTNPQSTLEVNGRIGFTTYISEYYGVSNNILIGDEATGASLQQQGAVNNIFVGRSAGRCTTGGRENVFLGTYAGEYNTLGSHNNFIGVGAGKTSIDGCFNNFIGWSAGYYSNSGSGNNFFGSSAGYYNSYGNSNNFFGGNSGYNNNTGSLNNFFGFNAGLGNSIGSENNFIGYYAGSVNQSGSNNIYIGSKTGLSTISSYKIILGNGSGYNYFDSPNVEADKQFAVGLNTTGTAEYWLVGNENFNVGIGTTNPTAKLHVQGVIGFGAGDNIKLGDSETGKSITSGTDNFFVGIGAGSSTSSGSENIFLGKWSGYCNTLGNENIFLGRGSGYYNTIGYNNIFFGTYAGRYNTEGVDNIFIGNSSGSSNIDGDFNNFFGKNSGYGNTSGIGNNFFGCSSGACNVSGNYNTFFGDQAGCSNTIGSNNVVIGNSRQTPIIDESNQLAIGAGSTDWIVGNSSYNVGIGTTDPTSKLTVVGNVNVSGIISATSFVGDGSGLTGVSGSSGVNGFVLSYMF